MTRIGSDQKAPAPLQLTNETEQVDAQSTASARVQQPEMRSGNSQLGVQNYGTTSLSVTHTTPLPSSNSIGIRVGSWVQSWVQRIGEEPIVGHFADAPTVEFIPGVSPFMGLRGDQVIGWDNGERPAHVSPNEVPRQPNLTPEERAWETQFVDAFCEDPRGLVKDFRSLVGDSHIYEVDLAKRCFPGYGRADKPASASERRLRAEANVPLHQVATAITKLAFLERLDELAELPDDDPAKLVLTTSGGCAAGKGELANLVKVMSPSLHFGAVWDAAGENNALENSWVLRECVERGIEVIFGYVHADPVDKIHAVLERALFKGRMVDVVPFTYSYLEGAKNMATFLESPEYLEAQAKGLASSFGLSPGAFNKASLEDPALPAFPDAKPLPTNEQGSVEVPQHGEPRKVLDAVLDDVDRHSTEMVLPDSLMYSALAGLGRRWPGQRELLGGSRHV